MVIRHLEKTKVTGAAVGFGNTHLSASFDIFLMSLLTSMYDPRTLHLPLLQPTNQSEPDAAVHQPTPGSSAFLPSSLQHQAKCLQTIHKTVQQFNQHLKAELLDRQKLQLIVLQLQNDFALLRHLLFSPVETISNKDITVKNSATSPLFISKPNPNPTTSGFPLPGPSEPKLCRSTPVGAVGPPRTKTNNSVNVDF